MNPEKRTPGGNRANEGHSRQLQHKYTTASVKSLRHELAIILAAAHRMASGYGLHWDDYDRLHSAHQHVLRVLAAVSGRGVMQ